MKRGLVSTVLHMPLCLAELRTSTTLSHVLYFLSFGFRCSFQYPAQSPIYMIETTQSFRIPSALKNRFAPDVLTL